MFQLCVDSIEPVTKGIEIFFNLGAVGVVAVAFAVMNYLLIRRIIAEASSDKKLLIETLTTTVSSNTSAMNRIAEALKDLQERS